MRKTLLSLIFVCFSASLIAAQAIVFDFGGVMNSPTFKKREAPAHLIRETFGFSPEECDLAISEMQYHVATGKTHLEFWESYTKNLGLTMPDAWAESLAYALWNYLGINPKMYALVDRLKEQNIRVAMLSNTTDYRSKLIRSFGLYDPFDPCLLSCETGIRKPDPKAYALLLQKLNLPAFEVIFIDDRVANIQAARQLGIDGILFESEEQLKLELINRGVLANSE